MNTTVTGSPEEAAAFIRKGAIVAFPTETVYGLGADIFNEDAIRRVFEAKNRPPDNPLIAHVSNIDQITRLADRIPASAGLFIEKFFPGPLTIVLPKRDEVPHIATAGLDTVGVRMPGEQLTREFLAACGIPIVAPSANVSGRPSPTTWQAVLEDLDGVIDCVLKGDPSRYGLESTVVDCTEAMPVVLRSGAVSIEDLRAAVPETVEYSGEATGPARSPGMRHRHYSPRAKVRIVERGAVAEVSGSSAFIGFGDPPEGARLARKVGSADEYARVVFDFFRECDRAGVGEILCEPVEERGIGSALMDRLRRAAE